MRIVLIIGENERSGEGGAGTTSALRSGLRSERHPHFFPGGLDLIGQGIPTRTFGRRAQLVKLRIAKEELNRRELRKACCGAALIVGQHQTVDLRLGEEHVNALALRASYRQQIWQ